MQIKGVQCNCVCVCVCRFKTYLSENNYFIDTLVDGKALKG